jgi:hypothetical protein
MITLSHNAKGFFSKSDSREIHLNQSTSPFFAFSTAIATFNKPQQLGRFVPLTGNTNQMNKFFDALKNSRSRVIRIAHFGDSLIQGDIISDHLRDKLQNRFGGKGAGFLSIISNDIKMKRTTKHSFSDDWDYVSIVTRNPNSMPFGISGTVAVPKRNSWVKYEATTYFNSTNSFSKVRIYYSHSDNNSIIEYTWDGKNTEKIKLNAGEKVNELIIDAKGNRSTILIKFISGKSPYIYGVSLESGNGLYLDNFSMPGNTGSSLLEIPKNTLKDFNDLSSYNLIILTYGANVSSSNKGIYTLYENKMRSVIEQFRNIFTKASFLLVGVGDKTAKVGTRFVTNPDVQKLLETQKRIVDKTKITFWNLWEAMGGENSMDEWVNHAPPLALKDYSHFTQLGGARVAQLIYEAIMDSYDRMAK